MSKELPGGDISFDRALDRTYNETFATAFSHEVDYHKRYCIGLARERRYLKTVDGKEVDAQPPALEDLPATSASDPGKAAFIGVTLGDILTPQGFGTMLGQDLVNKGQLPAPIPLPFIFELIKDANEAIIANDDLRRMAQWVCDQAKRVAYEAYSAEIASREADHIQDQQDADAALAAELTRIQGEQDQGDIDAETADNQRIAANMAHENAILGSADTLEYHKREAGKTAEVAYAAADDTFAAATASLVRTHNKP